MASYTGFGRTEPFDVKNVAALKEALIDADVTVHVEPGMSNTVVVLSELDDGGWTTFDEDDNEVDFIELIVPHIADGDIAIFLHIGREKMRYLNSIAVAVTNDGRRITQSMSDFYSHAKAALDSAA